jgi:2-polyprenyl-3-methyl-5-hydroxy-6-metoxy-1,4-benzoquinol methylase
MGVLGEKGFDCVAALAVLHHIPGYATRRSLLTDLASIIGPEGRIILSTWQFLDSPRLQRRIVPWEVLGLADEQLEPGDYLLDWRQGGLGLRYCHLVDMRELETLAEASGLRIIDTTRAGGREGNLSLIAVLKPG